MLTFFSFLLTFFGTLNWFFIAVLQYDIIAGIFGFQASLLSRLCYFLIGMAGFALVILALKGRGTLKIFENPFKKNKKNSKIKDENYNYYGNNARFYTQNHQDGMEDIYTQPAPQDFNREEERSRMNERAGVYTQLENARSGQNNRIQNHNYDEQEYYIAEKREPRFEKRAADGYKDFDVTQYD